MKIEFGEWSRCTRGAVVLKCSFRPVPSLSVHLLLAFLAGTRRATEEMGDGRIGQSDGRTVIQFTIWPSIYLARYHIISSISRALDLSLSLSLPLGFLSFAPVQRGKWDFLTKTHHRRRPSRRRLRERPINVGGGGIKRNVRGDINRRHRTELAKLYEDWTDVSRRGRRGASEMGLFMRVGWLGWGVS